MASRDVVFIPALPFADLSYGEYALKTWSAWCARHGVTLFVWDQPFERISAMKPTWQRYAVFDILEQHGIGCDRVLLVDLDTMVHWDCPNFFATAGEGMAVVRDCTPIFQYQCLEAYQRFFPGVKVPWYDYFNAGFILLRREHRPLCKAILDFYRTNQQALLVMETRRLGTDQTPVNFLARREGVALDFLPPAYNLMIYHHDLHGEHIFAEGVFTRMGHVWHFSGSSPMRLQSMRAAWQAYGHRYHPAPTPAGDDLAPSAA
jgi:hypothetical protein